MTKSKHLTSINLDPFLRNAIGVERYMNAMINRIDNTNTGNYPPYNIIEVDDDNYIIELAVAGFRKSDIAITTANNQLEITGLRGLSEGTEEEEITYLHQGISARTFRRSFALADYVEVKEAEITDGILSVTLERLVPESMKPKEIEIK